MPLFSKIRNADDQVVETARDFLLDPNLDQADTFGPDKAFRWVPYLEESAPDYDPATQRLIRVVPSTVPGATHTVTWTVQDLTAEQQASLAETARRDTLRTGLASRVTWLRARADALEAAPAVTTGNAVQRLQAIQDELIVFLRGVADLIEARRLDQ